MNAPPPPLPPQTNPLYDNYSQNKLKIVFNAFYKDIIKQRWNWKPNSLSPYFARSKVVPFTCSFLLFVLKKKLNMAFNICIFFFRIYKRDIVLHLAEASAKNNIIFYVLPSHIFSPGFMDWYQLMVERWGMRMSDEWGGGGEAFF